MKQNSTNTNLSIAVTLKEVNYHCTDFIHLCDELDLFLNHAIGGEQKREKYKKFNILDTLDFVIVAYVNQNPIGCAALRKYSDDDMEVKRFYIREEYRGKNIGGTILERLIKKSKAWGYKRMILETGDFLADSVRLYSRYGFEQIPNYGAYQNMPESLCMGLNITKDAIIYCTGKWMKSEEIKELFESVGWLSANYSERLVRAFRQAQTVISAWQNDKLIGLTEVLDDGEATAYIHYLLVAPAYQNKKIGSYLMEKVKQKYKDYLYLIVLCEKKNTVPFYEKLNFQTADVTPLQIRTL